MEEDRSLLIQVAERHKNVQELQFVRDDPERFTLKRLAGGSSNNVFLVTSHDGKHRFVFKYAPGIIKNFAGTQMTPRRMDIDYYAIQAFNQLYPFSAPHVFCFDPETHSMSMDYMEGMESLTFHHDKQNHVDLEVVKKLGEIIGVVHKGTWTKNMPPEDAQALKDKFIIDEITEVKLMFDFERGVDEEYEMKYIEPEALGAFRDILKDGSMYKHRDVLMDMVRNKQQCLVHNDYYPGSVMVKGLDVKVYDMEFASISAAGTDIALMADFLIMGYVRSTMEGLKDKAALYLKATDLFFQTYMDVMEEVLPAPDSKKEMVEDISLFSGWLMISMTSFKDAHFHMRLSPEVKVVLWKIAKICLQNAKDLMTMKDYVNLVEKSCLDLTGT